MPTVKKQHALHNEEICDFLNGHGKAHDWVVTTAFYSALHHVQHEIFPLTVGIKEYLSFDEYYDKHYFNIKNKPSQHQCTIDLCYEHLGIEVGSRYKFLHDTCRKARYHNFKTNPRLAEMSREYLVFIKGELKKAT